MIRSRPVPGIHMRAFDQAVSIQAPPLCPDLSLWLIDAEVDLEAGCEALHEGESPPYWAFCWGSGLALARWLLDHPEAVSGRAVVDFGAGSGVAGIAAARAGAASVLAVDVDPGARDAIRANAELNGVRVGVGDTTPDRWDVLLASDVLYESSLRPVLEALRATARRTGATLLVAEPDRPGNPGHQGELLAEYAVRTFPDVDSPARTARVYRL